MPDLKKPQIDEESLFFDFSTMTLTEEYELESGKLIINNLCQVQLNVSLNNHQCNEIPWFIERRQNLHGHNFKIMTLDSPPHIIIDPLYKTNATFFSQNQTYEITNYVKGLYMDIFELIMEKLNASFTIYRRKDYIFGTLKNGKWDGMFENIVNGEVDLILTSLITTPDRVKVVHYFPTLDNTDVSGTVDATKINLKNITPLNRPNSVFYLIYRTTSFSALSLFSAIPSLV